MREEDGAVSLREAVRTALEEAGADVLGSPQRVVSYILDLCDDETPEVCVATQQSDAMLLTPLVKAAESPDTESLSLARAQMAEELEQSRFVNARVSLAVADALASGVADWVGIELESVSLVGEAKAEGPILVTPSPVSEPSSLIPVSSAPSAPATPMARTIEDPTDDLAEDVPPTAHADKEAATRTEPKPRKRSRVPIFVAAALVLVAAVVAVVILVQKPDPTGFSSVPLLGTGEGIWVCTGYHDHSDDDFDFSCEVDAHGNKFREEGGYYEYSFAHIIESTDELGQPTVIRVGDPSDSQAPGGTTYRISYYELGKIREITREDRDYEGDAISTYVERFDENGYLIGKLNTFDWGQGPETTTITITCEHDASGNITSWTRHWPDGSDETTTCEYDGNGCISHSSDQRTYSHTYVKDPSIWAYSISRLQGGWLSSEM